MGKRPFSRPNPFLSPHTQTGDSAIARNLRLFFDMETDMVPYWKEA